MFFGGDDDDADFAPREGSSKLASLFGMDKASSQGGNESLKYQAPKEPKKDAGSSGAPAGSQPTVLHAVATHTYKYVDGKYESQGKLGTAIIGNHTTREYKLLLYQSKTQQVTHAVITADFSFTVQPSNYAAFYDHGQQNWSIMFDTETQISQFVKQIALARANTAGTGLDRVIYEDIQAGEGGVLEVGDAVELRYTGWLLTECTLGSMFDTNTSADKLLRFKVGKGKVIKGLDEGVLGMKKGGTRYLVIPPQLGYGTDGSDKVPPSATLVYEVQAIRVKLSKVVEVTDVSVTEPTPAPAPSPTQTPGGPPERDPTDTRPTEPQAGVKPDKARIMSRIAKMGQAMFPVAEPTSPAPSLRTSESEPRTTSSTPEDLQPTVFKPTLPNKPVLPPTAQVVHQPTPLIPDPTQLPPGVYPQNYPYGVQTPHSTHLHTHGYPGVTSSQLAPYQSPMMMPQLYGQPGYAPVQYPPPAAPPVTMATDSSMPMLLSETRTQTTEMRVTLSKVADKVDKISDKLDQMFQSQGHQQQGAMATISMTPHMETTVLLHNIQRIVQENERLKREVLEKSTKIETQNEKISDLLNRNQQFLEQSNTLLEQRSDTFKATAVQSQSKLLTLEQDKVRLTTELTSITGQLSAAQLQLNTSKKQEAELRSQLDGALSAETRNKEQLQTALVRVSESERGSEQLSEELRGEREQRRQLEAQLHTIKEEMADLKTSKENIQKSHADSKQKWSKEKDELEQELTDARKQYEDEVTKLKEKLRVIRSSSSADANTQLSELEEDLNKNWQEKSDRLLAAAGAKHQGALNDAREDQKQLKEELSQAEQKYENLRVQAATMKDRYESKINELQSHQGAAAGGISKDQMSTKVKQIMSSVYHDLKGQFDAETSYKGQEINTNIMSSIKSVTLRMMKEGQDEDILEESEMHSTSVTAADIITAVRATTTGDHGNPYYTRELNQEEPVEVMVATSMSQTSAAAPKHHKQKSKQELSAEVIRAVVAPSTGDKGNPYYAKELKDAEKKEKQTDSGRSKVSDEVMSEVISAMVAPSTGDKGNPHYAKELNKSGDKKEPAIVSVEEPMVAAAVSQTTAAKPPSSSTPAKVKDDQKARPEVVAELISAAVATRTGDRGNPHYAAELSEAVHKEKVTESSGAKPVAVENIITAAKSYTTGDRGNPHYAKQLDQNQEESHKESVAARVMADMIKPVVAPSTGDKDVGEPMIAATVSHTSTAAPPKLHNNDKLHTSDKPTDTHKTTQKTNEQIFSEVIRPAVAPSTGDRGNPYYAAELDQAGSAEKQEALFSDDTGKPVTSGGDPSNDLTQKVSALQKLVGVQAETSDGNPDIPFITPTLVHQEGGQTSEATVGVITPKSAPITGDKGNPYRAEELRKLSQESDTPHTVDTITVKTTYVTGEGSTVAEEGEPASKIACVAAPERTGGWGNPHREAEILRQEQAKVIVAGVISAVVAPSTGDKGNPHYAAELDSKADKPDSLQKTKDTRKYVSESAVKDNKSDKKSPKDSEKSEQHKDSKPKESKEANSDKVTPSSDKVEASSRKDVHVETSGGKSSQQQEQKPQLKGDENVKEKSKVKDTAKVNDTVKVKDTRHDSDDDLKPRPPPLFDDPDDDDLDWLK